MCIYQLFHQNSTVGFKHSPQECGKCDTRYLGNREEQNLQPVKKERKGEKQILIGQRALETGQ